MTHNPKIPFIRFGIIGILLFACLSANYAYTQLPKTKFRWKRAEPESMGMSAGALDEMKQALAEKGTKKLLVIKQDHIVYEWYADGWKDSLRRHYAASLSKALVGGMSLLLALENEWVYPDMAACLLIPEWKSDAQKSKITLRQLATHTSGLDDAEVNEGMQANMSIRGLHPHMDLPGWKGQFWRKDPDPFSVSRDSASVRFVPGTHFNYSNPGIAMLTYAVTAALEKTPYPDIHVLLRERVYGPIGMTDTDAGIGYGQTYEVGGLSLVPSWGGSSFTANGAARIGRLMLNKGLWEGETVIDSSWTKKVLQYAHTAVAGNDSGVVSEFYSLRTPRNAYPATTMGWYSNVEGVWEHVPKDAFAGGGAGHQLLLVIPSLDLIVVRFGDDLADSAEKEGFWTAAERHLFNPLMDAITASPYPHSEYIENCEFEPATTVTRQALGSDNWPVTWADDDQLYTAYGDGWGFDPRVDMKLSLGIASIAGSPPDIQGVNIRTESGERVGQGKYGAKASGMLFVNDTLYMVARNTGNAQLAWSADYGASWTWAAWTFDVSFGCPTFLNYGKAYEGARDEYVYLYTQDASTAYEIADRMVLARVRKDQLKNWRSYEYFAGYDVNQEARWSVDIRRREAIFSNPGKCYRSGISYNSGLQRYIWCQIIPLAMDDEGPRFAGGLGIFEAPEPWGPWKTVFYTRKWDIGPGETISIPTKWISPNGKICYLAFSGEDAFSVRQVRFSPW